MTCTRCGAGVGQAAMYCGSCGTRIERPWVAKGSPTGPAEAPMPTREAARWSEAVNRPFRFAGAWWTRDISGRVGTWDEERGRWVAADFYETPFFMRRPEFTSLRTPAIWLYVLLGLFLLATLGSIAASANMISVLNRIVDGQRVSFPEWDDAESYLWVGCLFMSLFAQAIAPFFIWWTRRATCNVPALGAAKPEFTPGWAIGWWFIPFANLVQPLRVLNQAWRASAPGLPPWENVAWRKAKLTALLPIWWITYLACSVSWGVAWAAWDPATDAERLRNLTAFLLMVNIAMGAVAVVTIAFVAWLTRRQEEANQRFDPPAGLARLPEENVAITAGPPPAEATLA